MREHTTVYDLGEVDLRRSGEDRGGSEPPTAVHRVARPARGAAPRHGGGFDVSGTLSLFLPGAGHLAHGEWATGLFILSSMGFLVSLGWAILETLDRLIDTLRILGYPGAPAVWTLAGIYVLAATLHVGGLLTGSLMDARAPHPALAGIASALFPGWGQVLAGSRRRAALFVTALWAIGALWFLASPAVRVRLDELGLYLPDALAHVTAPAVLWTSPAVLWALAVYDAISGAAARR